MERRSDVSLLLRRAKELLQRGPEWRPPLHARVRWWNLALGVLVLLAIAAIVIPLRNAEYRDAFGGNIVAEAWGLIASAVVAWVVFRRFKAERFERAIPIAWDKPFEVMRRISLALYPAALGEAFELRSALNSDTRTGLCDAAVAGFRKASLYGRFLEIEQIVDIERCCEAAEALAALDDQLPDSDFMRKAAGDICSLYVWSSTASGSAPSREIVETLHATVAGWKNITSTASLKSAG